MGTAIGIVAVVGIIVFLVWAIRQPIQETTMGKENKARREAKKAAKGKSTETRSDAQK